MELTTARFGVIQVPEDSIFTFEAGLPGFRDLRRYAILKGERFEPFHWLQSLDNPELAFLVVDPLLFLPDYVVEVTSEEIRPIGLEDVEGAFILVIVTMPADPREMTANLRAPLIFNPAGHLAQQLILTRTDYPLRHRMFESTAPGAVPSESAKS